ncbi:MAG: hypothetical protein PVH87_10195 [Desulfobacteraceae bacterium]|jgi:hypothetical protein
MINNISEGALRVASKIDPSGAIHEKEVNQQKAREIREARPVEKSDQGNKAEARNTKEDETTGKFRQDDRHMVFEKYDKNGDLILRIPPSLTPVDKVV